MSRPAPRYWQMPGHLIRRLHQLSTQVFLQQVGAAGYNLTPVQFAALDALADRPGIDQARLAEAIAKDRATIGAVVDRLQQKGLLHRVVSGRDKRARDLCLTEEGERIVAELRPLVIALQADILPGLTRAEVSQFIQLATKASRLSPELLD